MPEFDIKTINLYKITHIANIRHILQYGIVKESSPNANPSFVPIGDTSLIDYRSTMQVTIESTQEKIILGDFIPFYFGIRSPMLYVIQHGFNFVTKARKAEEIVYVAVSLQKILDRNYTYYFSDGHATDKLSVFHCKDEIQILPSILDWNAILTKNGKVMVSLRMLKEKSKPNF